MTHAATYKIADYARDHVPAPRPSDGRWFRVPNDLIDSGLLSDIARGSRAKLLIMLLALRHRGEDGVIDLSAHGPTVGHLAPAIGCSKSETYAGMKSLVGLGLLAESEGTMRYALTEKITFAGRREKPPPEPDQRPVGRTDSPAGRTASGSMSFVPSEREKQKQQQQSARASGEDEKSQTLRLLLCELEHDFVAARELAEKYPPVEIRRAIANLRQLRKTGKLAGRPAAYVAACCRDGYSLEKVVSNEASKALKTKLVEAVDAWAAEGGPLDLLRAHGMATPGSVLNARLTDPIEIERASAAELVGLIDRRAKAYVRAMNSGMVVGAALASKAGALAEVSSHKEA